MIDEIEIRKKYGSKPLVRRTPLSVEVRRGIYYLLLGLSFITVVLSIVFLLNTSNSAQKGYVSTQLRLKKEYLEDIQRELKIKVLEAKSLLNLENDEKNDEMVEPENVDFLR